MNASHLNDDNDNNRGTREFGLNSIALGVCVLGVAMLTCSNARARRPNVILLMADDMGYEALACNGGTTYETPKLDAIAAQGMRFTNCYSQPVCTPSRVKIMTGRSNARNYTAFGVLIPEERTFGNIMKAAGYKTGISGKWQLSGKGNGTTIKGPGTWMDKCGFDESCMWAYQHYLSEADFEHYRKNASKFINGGTSRFWNPGVIENGEYRPTTVDDYGPDIYSEFLLDFITKNRDEEFFYYFPMALTHAPFVPTPESADLSEASKFKSDTKHFGDMVRYCGTILERIVKRLDEHGIAEETLVLFTCDNGTGPRCRFLDGRPIGAGRKGHADRRRLSCADDRVLEGHDRTGITLPRPCRIQ